MNFDNLKVPIIPTPTLKRIRSLSEDEIGYYDKAYREADVIYDSISMSEDRVCILKGIEKLVEVVRLGIPQKLKLCATDGDFYHAWEKVRGNKK